MALMDFNKSVSELVEQRFSCRSYHSKPIQDETRQQLAEYVASSHQGPFSTPMRFELVAATDRDRKALRELGTYGFISGATGFIIGAIQDGEKNLEDFGYLMEHLILYATDLGLGTCWLGGTFTKSSFAKKISANHDELVPAVVSVGYPAEKPRRIDLIIRRGADVERRQLWEELFFDSRFGVPLLYQQAGEYRLPLEMVRLGPSASNQQPWRIIKDHKKWHFYLQRTPGYRESLLNRLFTVADMQLIDMGIAMSHFELMAHELGLEGKWEIDEPEITYPDEWVEYIVSWVG